MASTYSTLKIELIGTGEQVGTWGSTTNTNLGTAIEEAIVGSADVSFSSGDVTLTLTNTNASQSARHLRLNLTGTSGGARNLILGSGCQIDKPYIINNGLADAVTVKNTTGTGVAVPAGKSMWVFNNGTNVVEAMTHFNGTISLTSPLSVASGGTGAATLTGVVKGNGTSAFTASNVNLASEVTGTLPVANGGTGQTSFTDGQLLIGNTTGNTLTKATLTAGTGISVTNGNGSITIATSGGGGDVTGPASSTDNAIARFDSTTGKLIQNSGVTIDDSNNVTGINNLSFNSGYGSAAVAYGCRAWVSFVSNLSIRGSGNVSSISSIVTNRDYQVNFSAAMPDANYCVTTCGASIPGTYFRNVSILTSSAPQTTHVAVTTQIEPFATPYINVAIFR